MFIVLLSFQLPWFSLTLPTSLRKNIPRIALKHYSNTSSVWRQTWSAFDSWSFPSGTENIHEFHPQNNHKAKTCARIFLGQSSWGWKMSNYTPSQAWLLFLSHCVYLSTHLWAFSQVIPRHVFAPVLSPLAQGFISCPTLTAQHHSSDSIRAILSALAQMGISFLWKLKMFILIDVQNYNFRLGSYPSVQTFSIYGIENGVIGSFIGATLALYHPIRLLKGETRIWVSWQWPFFLPPPQLIARKTDACGSPRTSCIAHSVPPESNRGKRTTAVRRMHSIPLQTRLLPATAVLWHTTLLFSAHLQEVCH